MPVTASSSRTVHSLPASQSAISSRSSFASACSTGAQEAAIPRHSSISEATFVSSTSLLSTIFDNNNVRWYCTGVTDIALQPGRGEREALIRRVKLISWLSLVWMTTEGVIGTTVGIMANSIALIGYGIDSTITGVASVIIIWRFSADRADSDLAEKRAQKIVAITFFLLAPYIMVAAVHHLLVGSEAEASWVGISLAVVSVTLMPVFGRAKKRIGNRLQSSATAGEGTQNILCAYLSLAILIGLVANAVFGLWWADPLAALVVASVAVHTGVRTWRGEACEIPTPSSSATNRR